MLRAACRREPRSPALRMPSRPALAAPLLAGVRLEPLVLAHGEGMELALKLAIARIAVAVERSVGERAAHSASGLPFVAAVVEVTLLRERLDVTEGRVETLADVPELELAHAGCIEQQAPAW